MTSRPIGQILYTTAPLSSDFAVKGLNELIPSRAENII